MKSRLVQTGLRIGFVTLVVCTILGAGCESSNSSPKISRVTAEKAWITPSARCQIECIASDTDNDSLSYTWSATGGTFSGEGEITTWIAPQSVGAYEITVKVTDDEGGEITGYLPISVQTNHSPIISSLDAVRTVANRGEYISIECVASDTDQDRLIYSWLATGGEFHGTGPLAIWTAPYSLDIYEITVVVKDDRGGVATKKISIEVGVNHSPVIESLTAEPSSVLQGETITVECLASDSDGDELTYMWTAEDGDFAGDGSIVTWAAPMDCKYYNLTVLVADGRGGETSKELQVRVKKPG